MALNTTLNYKDKIEFDVTIQVTIDHFISWLRSPSEVLNGQRKHVIVASEPVSFHQYYKHLESKTLRLLQIIPADAKNRSKVKFTVKLFSTINFFLCREND